jgi:hypothetical protein
MKDLHARFLKAEKMFQAYIPETEADAVRRSLRDDSGKPQFTTMVIPYTYSLLLSAHSYWTSVFMSRQPVFQFLDRHGEGKESSHAIEALIDYQVQVGRMLVPFYLWLLDVGKYGLGVVMNWWEEEIIQTSRIEEVDEFFMPELFGNNMPTGKKLKKKFTHRGLGYVGNKIANVRPSEFFPDTRLPLHRFQEGEFCGRLVKMGWNQIVKREKQKEYFNLEALRSSAGGAFGDFPIDSPNTVYPSEDQLFSHLSDTRVRPFIEMFVELDERDWGLGRQEGLEKWVFTATEDMTTLIGARPAGSLHGKFPFGLIEYEPDAYVLAARGMPELLRDPQNVVDWLVNTHMYSVRKLVNGQTIFDPSRVQTRDLLDNKLGGLIRLRPTAYGTPVGEAIARLESTDPTLNHPRDVSIFMDLMNRMVGVNDAVQGQVGNAGRRSATEFRGTTNAALNRLKTNSEFYSAMGWSDLAQMFVQNSQDFLEESRYYRTVGDLSLLQRKVLVGPEDIQGFFDYIPVDGSLPVDKFAMANLWRELFVQLTQIPVLLAQYDIGGIFSWVAQLSGLKNIGAFKIKTVEDGAAQVALQSGNLVPQGEALPQQVGVGPSGLETASQAP